jgi:hypothetical protein
VGAAATMPLFYRAQTYACAPVQLGHWFVALSGRIPLSPIYLCTAAVENVPQALLTDLLRT